MKPKKVHDSKTRIEKARSPVGAPIKRTQAARARSRREVPSGSASLAAPQALASLQKENRALRAELANKEEAWRRQMNELESHSTAALQAKDRQLHYARALHSSALRERETQLQALLMESEAKWNRLRVNQHIRDVVRAVLPAGARVLVISKGDDDLLQLDGRLGGHFPQMAGGVYAGHHPANSADAIAHLEALKAQGAQFLMIPATSFWWMDYYRDFGRHLESHYRLATYNEATCLIFALDSPSPESKNRVGLLSEETPQMNSAAGAKAPSAATQPTPAAPSTCPPIIAGLRSSRPTQAEAGAPPVAAPRTLQNRPPGTVFAACVLDEFTTTCLRPECSLVTFRPDNWESILERAPVDLLLVESAWRGNEGSWQYKIASFQRPMGEELANLVQYCKTRDIPTVFWNKEDPAHFDRFINRAPLFDFVFTTDADCIPRYRERLGHDRVFALPFAAQPAIHNPINDQARNGAVCFAGTYYGDRHQARQADMDKILRPAIPFGLEIYDRQHGMIGKDTEAYRFPEIYRGCIKGRLEYGEMLKAYKRYKVFLNVNSVKDSPTMFSRRVFELLACGTPVISTYSRGIVELLGDDVVFLTNSEAETRQHLERLLGSDGAWSRASVRGIRKVLGEHTYRNRLRDVLERAGVQLPANRQPSISLLVRVSSKADIEGIATLLAVQTFRRFSLILASKTPLSARALAPLGNALPGIMISNPVGPTPDILQQCRRTSSDYLALVNPRDSYGPNYLQDFSLAAMYSGAEFLGKRSFYTARENGKCHLNNPGHEFQFVSSVASSTLMAKTEALSEKLLEEALANPIFQPKERQILAIDRFNYLQDEVFSLAGGKPGCQRARISCSEVQV